MRLPAGAALALALLSCASPEERAVSFLAREVPQWPQKNRCFSCHNNGDAARALFAARERSIAFDPRALDSTREWLSRPDDWKNSGPPGEISDKRLAALQFAFALSSSGAPPPALARAAALVREQQDPDGSWAVDAGGLPGSPVTWGRTLATAAAREVLERAGLAEAAAKAGAWLRAKRPVTVLDAGALLLAPGTAREACLDLLRKGQSRDGGWGPYATSPPEAFDTAVALLGLARVRDEAGVPEMIRRGRAYLESTQQPDGSWPETTRPAGAESYAQRISTSGWATLALLATETQSLRGPSK